MTTQDERIPYGDPRNRHGDPPGYSPPLRLPPRPSRIQGTLWRRGPQQWPAWVAPLAAAITVTAVIAGAFALTREIYIACSRAGAPWHRPGRWLGRDGHGRHRPATVLRLSRAGPARQRGRAAPTRHDYEHAHRKADRHGSGPAPLYVGFDYVAAACNSSTFVLAAQQQDQRRAGHLGVVQKPEKFFLLQVSPAGHAQLTPLSVPVKVYPGFWAGHRVVAGQQQARTGERRQAAIGPRFSSAGRQPRERHVTPVDLAERRLRMGLVIRPGVPGLDERTGARLPDAGGDAARRVGPN